MESLYIIIPAYNEEANIEAVVNEWHKITETIASDSKLVIVNDGSTDSTQEKLMNLQNRYSNLTVLNKKNSGHGATLLYGYQYALDNGADYIFQTDSDGQTISSEFWDFWNQRHQYDLLIGDRVKRGDGFSRVFVTKTLKLILRLVFHEDIQDANTPFRLFTHRILSEHIKKIPDNFNLSNVMLTVSIVKSKSKVKFIPITFRQRQGGKNSINLRKISKIGVQAIKDFRDINRNL